MFSRLVRQMTCRTTERSAGNSGIPAPRCRGIDNVRAVAQLARDRAWGRVVGVVRGVVVEGVAGRPERAERAAVVGGVVVFDVWLGEAAAADVEPEAEAWDVTAMPRLNVPTAPMLSHAAALRLRRAGWGRFVAAMTMNLRTSGVTRVGGR